MRSSIKDFFLASLFLNLSSSVPSVKVSFPSPFVTCVPPFWTPLSLCGFLALPPSAPFAELQDGCFAVSDHRTWPSFCWLPTHLVLAFACGHQPSDFNLWHVSQLQQALDPFLFCLRLTGALAPGGWIFLPCAAALLTRSAFTSSCWLEMLPPRLWNRWKDYALSESPGPWLRRPRKHL